MRISLFLFGLLIIGTTQAQQLPQFSQVALNRSLYNPAFIGDEQATVLTLGGRWQMIGFGQEPQSAFLNFEKNLTIKPKPIYNPYMRISVPITEGLKPKKSKFSHSVGGQLSTDKYGAFRSFQLSGLYGAHYQFTNSLKVSGGLKLGVSNNGFDADKAKVLNLQNPENPYTGGDTEYDQFVSGKWNTNIINIGAGINVQYEKFFISVAANQLTKDVIRFGNSNVNFNLKSHLFFITGYTFELTSEVKLKTTAVVKIMQPAPISIEGSAIADIGSAFFAGLTYHHNASAGLIVGFQVNEKFRVGYALDVPTTGIYKSSLGGHELVLNYRFK